MERIILKFRAYKNKHRRKFRTFQALTVIAVYLILKHLIGLDADFLFLAWWLYFLQEIRW